MFKRSGALLLTLLYTVTVMGFALNLHYCFSRVTLVKLDAPVTVNCGMQGRKMKCCQDKHIEVKVKDVHQGESASFLTGLSWFQIPSLSFFTGLFNIPASSIDDNNNGNDPPDHPPINNLVTFLKNCVFRI